MNGGESDYLHSKIRQAIDEIHDYECADDNTDIYYPTKYHPFRTKKHARFLKHLSRVADALKDIEWVMSGDTSPGDEIKAINKVLNERARKGKKKYGQSNGIAPKDSPFENW